MAVEKLDDMETAFIDIEMDVSYLKVRRTGFPDFCIRIQPLNFFPGCEANRNGLPTCSCKCMKTGKALRKLPYNLEKTTKYDQRVTDFCSSLFFREYLMPFL